MRRVIALVLAATAALAATVAAPDASAATYRYCGLLRDVGPTGRDPADARGIQALGTSCTTARYVARTWFRRPGNPNRVGAFTCRGLTTGARYAVRCSASGGRLVRWYLG